LFEVLRKPIATEWVRKKMRLLELVADSFSIVEFTGEENG
jgi:hypothetical protein